MSDLVRAADGTGRIGSLIEILLLQAIALHANRSSSEASSSLERALFLAEPEGYIRIFVDEGEAMRLLIVDSQLQLKMKLPSRLTDSQVRLLNYMNKLLAAFSYPELAGIAQSSTKNQFTSLITGRELEILRLLAEGCSNQQISKKLFVTNSTVKSHIHHMFRKIGVESRIQLIVRANELKLI